MQNLNSNQRQYWDSYINSLPAEKRPVEPNVEAFYAGNPSITDELLHLYLIGKKTAGSSIVEDSLTAGDPLPKVGNYWILPNGKGEPGCILLTERVETHKFKDVPDEVARAEGEGDSSLEYWRKVHAELYLPHLQAWGVSSLDEATVITEHFKLVYR